MMTGRLIFNINIKQLSKQRGRNLLKAVTKLNSQNLRQDEPGTLGTCLALAETTSQGTLNSSHAETVKRHTGLYTGPVSKI